MLRAAAAAIAIAAPQPLLASPLANYVEARAAEMQGDEARSARLYAAMASADPADRSIARRAIASAIASGQTGLAVSLAKRLPSAELAVDARLLLAADALRTGKGKQAMDLLENGATSTETDLFAPLVRAWLQTERRKADGAAALAKLDPASPLTPLAGEHRAAMLLTLGRADEALPLARSVVAKGGGRATRLRLAYADGLARLKRPADALAMLQGDDEALATARSQLAAGQPLGMAIATPADGFAELLVALAVDLSRDENKALPIALTQVARHASPGNSESTILLALLLDDDKRPDDALALLGRISRADLLAGEALDVETRILTDRNQFDRALLRARAASAVPAATAQDFARLANVLGDMERHAEAADAYGRAITLSKAGGSQPRWTLHLLRAASLEQSERWADAKTELATAMAIEPDNPILLNFLGYGKLERGEDIASAEAMIRKASALRPDDASITDSLGWALFKRGQTDEAIATLRRAAAGDPAQSEIHEHLGDALYTAGRKIEARFSWQAALLTAEDQAKLRIQGKIDTGLTAATAAP